MRDREKPGRKSLAASVGFHAAVLGVAWWMQLTPTGIPEFVIPAITLVSPPAAELAPEPEPAAEEELVVETPQPVVEETPPPVVEERPRRVEERPKPTPTPTPPPEKPAGNPEPSEELSGADLNVRMEGLRRDYPEYWGNIITQIRRCLRYTGSGRLETSILFYISRDGTVDSNQLRFVERSGNMNFDYAAMGAVECAGKGRFGPLPEGLGVDRLPILFSFRPSGGGGE